MRRPDALLGGHLPPDRVAACEAGQGTLPELAHLRRCAACRAEVAAIGRVLGLAEAWRDASGSGEGLSPLTSWETLAPALRREGLLRVAPGEASRGPATPGRTASAHDGRGWGAPATVRARRVTVPWRWTAVLAAAATVALLLPAAWRGETTRTGDANAPRMVVAEAGDGAVLPWDGDPAAFGGTGEAPDALARTRARVAALDRLLEASQEALDSAPGDPVLVRSVEQAHAAREAALRALGGTLPASHQLVRY
ncbi:MAG: hypothetical protein KJT01_11575 [Gemmatimonadetes bacterium]|nr:hypothetical protein [Gemmatimonadota bacterium]